LTDTEGLPIVNLAGYALPQFAYEDRSVVEFQNTAFPANALIQSVTFNFQDLGTSNNVHDVGVYVYPGSGLITLADATIPATQAGTHNDGAVGERSQSLDSSVFQSMLGQSSYFALRLQGLELGVNTVITSIEEPGFSNLFTPPSLTIGYTLQSVPEPSTLLLACVATAALLAKRRWSGTPGPA
jgi:hypothetical protein